MENELQSKEWLLDPQAEYRFELDPGTSVAIKLLKGNAEMFGFELLRGQTYLFGAECKAAVFTWQGCLIEVFGRPSTEYVSEETPMNAYGNLHIAFEQMRVRAKERFKTSKNNPAILNSPPERQSEIPRILVVGPENAGKTSLVKTLVNYTTRAGQGWTPLLVNLDPAEGGWAAPGAIGVAPISTPIPTCSPSNVLGTASTSAPTVLSSNALLPLGYWYGHAEVSRNPLLLEQLINNLGENVKQRQKNDELGSIAGIIVDTPSAFGGGPASTNVMRQRLIKTTIDAFKINVILVVGHEKLNVEMQRTYGSQITVVKVPKSGGVVELDLGYRDRVHAHQLHTYFYGQVIPPPAGVPEGSYSNDTFADNVLSPSSTVCGFEDLNIWRIGAPAMAPSDALPVGAKRAVSETQPDRVDPAKPGSGLLNAVLAIMSPPVNGDEEEILDRTVIGFVVVTRIDLVARKMTVLSPNQGSIAGKTAIVGSYEWQDQ
ncbi:hypothetical protein CYLTODRAFT_488383 [Cylindrobasidium torrendii FP15055 ss-10]|uniref:Polynucleotide 5'-hydroxyl-kinase GRC3 n=1 Tax=Cylindrobasidium torrendii FP15055 ss-10 TaxID=1314674 RepID=A0A0D7BIR0_9AGAR|nr:hypothetical protein CYLTODRAFT_488383 [Cylindrobasidium torrendii FP15055 ss-10]